MQMRAEDIMGMDSFWSVRERERAEEEKLQRRCMELQAQVDVATRVAALRHAPGFPDFLMAVRGLHALAREKLTGDETLTDSDLREVRGRVRGYEGVLALLTKDTITEALAKQLEESKTQLAEARRRRPKPQPEEPKVTP